MSTEIIIGFALVAAMPVAFLVWAGWGLHKASRRAESHFSR